MVTSATHRIDVEYVWPEALVRPSRETRLVYLDQNHWINLARAAVHKPEGAEYRDVLHAFRQARASGRAVFPLSLTHFMETLKITNHRRRLDVAAVMEELSGFATLIARDIVMRLELEAVLDVVAGPRPQSYAPIPLVGHGAPFAYGKTGRFRFRDGDRDVTDEVRALGPEAFDQAFAKAENDLDRAILRGPADDGEERRLRTSGWNPEVAETIGEERAQEKKEQAARFDDKTLLPDDPTDWRRQRVRDVVRSRYVIFELMEMVQEGLQARSLEIEEVWSDPDASRRFVDSMPSADTCVSLLTEYHRDPTFKWQKNHIFDIDALSVAVPYCDLIATDNQAVDALQRAHVPERVGSRVFGTLAGLVDALAI